MIRQFAKESRILKDELVVLLNKKTHLQKDIDHLNRRLRHLDNIAVAQEERKKK